MHEGQDIRRDKCMRKTYLKVRVREASETISRRVRNDRS